eukprot:3212071-Prymnesium_polylepis.1
MAERCVTRQQARRCRCPPLLYAARLEQAALLFYAGERRARNVEYRNVPQLAIYDALAKGLGTASWAWACAAVPTRARRAAARKSEGRVPFGLAPTCRAELRRAV